MSWLSGGSTDSSAKPLRSALKGGDTYKQQHTGSSAVSTRPQQSVNISSTGSTGETNSAKTLLRSELTNPDLPTSQTGDTMSADSRFTDTRYPSYMNPPYSGMSGQSANPYSQQMNPYSGQFTPYSQQDPYSGQFTPYSQQDPYSRQFTPYSQQDPYSQQMTSQGNSYGPYGQLNTSWNSGPGYNSSQAPGWYNMASIHNREDSLHPTPFPKTSDPNLSMASYPNPSDKIIAEAWTRQCLSGEKPSEADKQIMEDYYFDMRKGTKLNGWRRLGLKFGIEPTLTEKEINDETAQQLAHFANTAMAAYKAEAGSIGGTSFIGIRNTQADMDTQLNSLLNNNERCMRHTRQIATPPSGLPSHEPRGVIRAGGAVQRLLHQLRESTRMRSLSRLLPPRSLLIELVVSLDCLVLYTRCTEDSFSFCHREIRSCLSHLV